MNIDICEFTGGDLAPIMEVENRSFPDPWTENMFRDALDSPFQKIYVLYENGELIGYICTHVYADEGEILSLAVLPEKRRAGYGKLLLGFALEIMKKTGVTRVFLEVRKSNRPAICLYVSNGFLPVGVRKRYYRHPIEDATVMKKTLI